MGTTHIGKFDPQKTRGKPLGGQIIEGNHLSNLATSRECGNLIFLPPPPPIVVEFPSRQWKWYKLCPGQRTIQKTTRNQSVPENVVVGHR